MNNPEYYKASNKFSVPGLLLMFISMVVVGVAVSWIYLILNSVIPLIYLNILLAAGVSILLGFIGGKFVKIFKIRSPSVAITVAVLALIVVNYGKWAIYIARDDQKYIYDDMENVTLEEYADETNPAPYMYAYMFVAAEENGDMTLEEAVDTVYNAEEDGIKVMQAPLDEVLDFAKKQGYDTSTMTKEQKAYFESGISLWELVQFDIFLGEDVNTIANNSRKMVDNPDMNTLKFVKDNGKYKNTTYYLSHPGQLWKSINVVNAVGRWSINNHRYSLNSENNSLVSGVLLWLVWLGELLMLTIPALMMISEKAKAPFIESENDWAITDKPAPEFKFIDPYPTQSNSPSTAASSFTRDPDYLFTLEPLTALMSVPDRYFYLTYCRSMYYDYIYATLYCSTLTNRAKNQRQNRALVKNLRVDADFLATMFGRFHYQVPPLCQGENRAEEIEKESKERAKAEAAGRPLAPQRPKATGAEAIFDEPPINAKPKKESEEDFAKKQLEEERRQAELEHKMQPVETPVVPKYEAPPVQSITPPPGTPGGSGLMDGIDTSNLDLDNFDFGRK